MSKKDDQIKELGDAAAYWRKAWNRLADETLAVKDELKKAKGERDALRAELRTRGGQIVPVLVPAWPGDEAVWSFFLGAGIGAAIMAAIMLSCH